MQRHRILATLLGAALCFSWTPVMALEAHDNIQGPFSDPRKVTQKCLECHEDAATEVMQTQHWNWQQKQVVNGKEQLYGKVNAMTNFGIAVDGNWPHCTSCHIGYGWENASFDLKEKSNIDCLACHDTTDTYVKAKRGAGLPRGFTAWRERGKPVDLLYVARNVGNPNKKTCGSCHFGGCGAARVKHGDLDPSFAGPPLEIDIHMAADGQNFDCQKCHYPEEKHNIVGHYMAPSAEGTYQSGCVECHDEGPHELAILNSHYEAVACQTCHIPTFARQYPAKTDWDWSTPERKSATEGRYGKIIPVKGVGAFSWKKNMTPIYEWYNGAELAYMRGDKINPDGVTALNKPVGSKADKHAKIFPFKIHRAKQIYDTKYKTIITPFIEKEGETAFWKTYDWDAAAKKGMAATGLRYSGNYDFTNTIMYWRINHGVVPGDKALDCLECHGSHGRMDWQDLGYEGDPWKIKGISRAPHKFQ
jgi:octaheme c-type cytochrome (tetrathionate reductase family)